MKNLHSTIFALLWLMVSTGAFAQKMESAAIQAKIEAYQNDPRGPYKDIRWFCPDGTQSLPKEKCAETGGVQRARYKDEVAQLAREQHIFLGQILSTTPEEDFWDTANNHSRAKQYQLEKYLRAVDDGWVLRKGQYYRGAFQTEDEEAWGVDFFNWLLNKEAVLEKQYFLVRETAKAVPHRGADSNTEKIRALSLTIADAYPAFMNLRVKIHGQPEASDLPKVEAFLETHQNRISTKVASELKELIAEMQELYQENNFTFLTQQIKKIPTSLPIRTYLDQFQTDYAGPSNPVYRATATAELMYDIRLTLLEDPSPKTKLTLLDISLFLETLFFQDYNQWNTNTLEDSMDKICHGGLAAAGCGILEQWEWNVLSTAVNQPTTDTFTVGGWQVYLESARSLVEWGTNTYNGTYKDVVNLFGSFEPKASGFFDDRIRSSVLLPLGNEVGKMGRKFAEVSKLSNQVLDLKNQSNFRGLNPGYARGELVVIQSLEEDIDVENDKIYVFQQPPADLKPVAGILTVTEGNMVSHVQLLARNLGIPNAVLSQDNMEALSRYDGQEVFLAVSNQGTVLMKLADRMNEEEEALFSQTDRSEEKVSVPIERIDLRQTQVLNMRSVDAQSSGSICGPKAANLGQLKQMFPDKVVEGLVIPFGIFRQHLDQNMPGQSFSYWEQLNRIFAEAETLRQQNKTESEIEAFLLAQLADFRAAIRQINLLPEFQQDLETQFVDVLGQPLGQIPVFLRSDTNMEDLKDFTGAGLNLTIFNARDAEKIWQGIRDVWASPYTERSFKWRQRYLLNPENVFPSILIIPSVDVDYSGVMITKGLKTGHPEDLTIAFSRGAGGAVDGQAAETHLLEHRGYDLLLAPAREVAYRQLPATGGSKISFTTFHQPILSGENRQQLRKLAEEIITKIPEATAADNTGPHDIELGFKDGKIWLFQIRPFVENKNAQRSAYLEKITPAIEYTQPVALTMTL